MRRRCEGVTMSISTEPPVAGMVQLRRVDENLVEGARTKCTFGVAKTFVGIWSCAVSTNEVEPPIREDQGYALGLK